MKVNYEKESVLDKEVLFLMSLKDKEKKLGDVIKRYKLKQLLEITAHLHSNLYGPSNYSEYDRRSMIKELLSERVRTLNNNDWIWTDEYKQRLSVVNDEIFNTCETGFNEAYATAELMEKRIKKRDSFLKDYEIDIKIAPYPKVCGASCDVTDTVSDYLANESLPLAEWSLSHCNYQRFSNEYCSILVNKDTNKDNEFYNKIFPGINICYLVHHMMESSVWSYPDILSIRRIWVDVEVTYQYYRNIPK